MSEAVKETVQPRIVLLVSGKRKCGKDYLSDALLKRLGPDRAQILRISEPIKRHWATQKGLNLGELLGDGAYKENYRKEMIVWSDEQRHQDYGVFCREACRLMNREICIVSDVRRRTDVQFFRETFDLLSSGAHGAAPAISFDDALNGTVAISHTNEDALSYCGANFCVVGTSDNSNLQRPPDSEIYEISAIYLSCIVGAVIIIAIFLDPLSRYGERRRGSISATEISGMQLLSATFKQLKKANQQLLILITVFIGMEQAFIGADFTQAYVSCALGIHQIGYVMICFGVVNAICSIIFGSAMKYIGRVVIIILGAIVHGGCIIYLLYWRPHPDHQIVFFILSGLWGIGDAVWQTQINGLYGALFRRNKEAAFSNYRLWESVGFVVAYAYSTALCARMKLYLLFGVLVCGMIGYTIVEIHQAKKEKRMKKLEEIPKQQQTEADRKAIEEDDEKDELEEDIVVTHL
ncbi:UNC93-like protein [Anopheles albimanus]|uniref:UNC93-like protein n=1 Tax=Anopheles albimanus TaxID=7167 RepID=UPI00163FA0F1|nr:UNC93-like protein [Anopheles albimanus]